MYASAIQYLSAHPMLAVTLGIIGALAVVGLWYVIAHHLEAIIITLICALGTAAGAVVFYRGMNGDMVDLLAIGTFLVVIFPVFYFQNLKMKRAKPQLHIDAHSLKPHTHTAAGQPIAKSKA